MGSTMESVCAMSALFEDCRARAAPRVFLGRRKPLLRCPRRRSSGPPRGRAPSVFNLHVVEEGEGAGDAQGDGRRVLAGIVLHVADEIARTRLRGRRSFVKHSQPSKQQAEENVAV